MNTVNSTLALRISEATSAVFGDSPLTRQVLQVCEQYQQDVDNITSGRGIDALLIAVVGAKGQGKTWVTRQFLRDPLAQARLPSGDLDTDATLCLTWVGPSPPQDLDKASEAYFPVLESQMMDLGQAYVLIDTPGITDENPIAAARAKAALSLATIKLLVIARDQVRAASNMSIAHLIEGSVCIPIITSVEPDEISGGRPAGELAADLRALHDQLSLQAPSSQLTGEVLVPDFEITADESAASTACIGSILDRLGEVGLTGQAIASVSEIRLRAAQQRLREQVQAVIALELPQLAAAVENLSREAQQLPERVLASILGSQAVLETGVRMRLRARLVSDTSLLWFPYRTLMSTLNLTQGAWDRVLLAMAGSVPSMFGALASWARNARTTRDFSVEIQDGIRKRAQDQIEQRLQPLCDRFHRAVMRLRPQEARSTEAHSAGMHLCGVEELQSRSQEIFEESIDRSATRMWLVQLLACLGVVVFWACMAGPIVVIYRDYFSASLSVMGGRHIELDAFPHPSPGLLLTSLLLSTLPLAVYCMLVMTAALSGRKVRRVAREIVAEHDAAITALKDGSIIRLDFEDDLLHQAEFLLGLSKRSASS